MSEQALQEAAGQMGEGDFTSAMQTFDVLRNDSPELAEAHYGWAEAAFMEMTINMADDVPAALVMRSYKKAMELDEENLGYVASFANFCLDCGRLPLAVKEYERLRKMAELEGLDVNDILFDASRLLVEAVERLDRRAPAAQPLLATALDWAVAGLGFDKEDAIEKLKE